MATFQIYAYASKKVRKSNDNLFGFVRYHTREDAAKDIRRLDGQKIRDCIISVKEARYDKKSQKVNRQKTDAVKKKENMESSQMLGEIDQRTCKEAVVGTKKTKNQ